MSRKGRNLGGVLAALLLITLMPATTTADTPREIAKRVSPSVVLLVTEDSNGQLLGMSSGFVVGKGVIATNMHVIEDAARGYAKFAGKKTKHDIRGIAASDSARDLVLLAVDGVKADPLVIGDSSGVAVADPVYAVGNPRGLEGTFSAGIVSSVRKVGDDSLLQITAPISPGSSGGPVVNSKGEVIGVAVATFKGGQNLNFAIPSGYLSALIPSIKAAVDLPKAAEARKAKKEKSILDDMGGRSTEGVQATHFLWRWLYSQTGVYSFSLHNRLREPVRDIICLVVFYGEGDQPIETDLVTLRGPILPGLAKRVKSSVEGSVQRITTPRGGKVPKTRTEFRILYFDVVRAEEAEDERSEAKRGRSMPGAPQAPEHPGQNAPRSGGPVSRKDVEAELGRLEKRLAEAAAKIAPAGDGPDLIESRIEGEFEGWEGETIFKLENGQIWQQVTFDFTYHFAFRPKVWIIKTHGAYKMKVDGVSGTIFVKRLK